MHLPVPHQLKASFMPKKEGWTLGKDHPHGK
jgi:hypothetical protein